MNSAWDWRGRADELRNADGSDEAKARQYGAATKRLQDDLPKLAKRLSTRQISEAYGVSQAYVQRVLRTARAEGKLDAPRYVRRK